MPGSANKTFQGNSTSLQARIRYEEVARIPSHRSASLVQIQTENIVHHTEDGYGTSTTCLYTSYWSGYRPLQG